MYIFSVYILSCVETHKTCLSFSIKKYTLRNEFLFLLHNMEIVAFNRPITFATLEVSSLYHIISATRLAKFMTVPLKAKSSVNGSFGAGEKSIKTH